MSRAGCLIVLCPNGRRESVKVTPNTSILQVLEEACSKQCLNPEDFDICHYNKPLDLSLPIRFSNLANNALLELNPIKTVRVESTVTVGLQLESGERLMKDFAPSSTLSDVVEQCLSLRTDVPMQDEAAGEPVCIYMRQKLIGASIKSTTLRSLGLTKGKAIIRLLYRQPDELNDQAHKSAPLKKTVVETPSPPLYEQDTVVHQPNKQPRIESDYKKPVSISHHETTNPINFNEPKVELSKDEDLEKAHTAQVLFTGSESSVANTESESVLASIEDDIMETNETEQEIAFEEISEIIYIGERHAVLYSLDDITEIKKADFPDEFFELTIDDVKYLMEQYRRERTELENQPLMIGAQKQNKLLQQLAHYRKTIIRIYFPEKLVFQAVFMVEETVQSVIDFVRNYLENKDLNFYLYITPPKEKLSTNKTLLEVALVPAAIVYFGCDVHHSYYLMNGLKDKVSDPRAAALAASNSRKESFSDVPLNISMPSVENSLPIANVTQPIILNTNPSQQPTRDASTKKVPKWLKLSK